jgi:hypothetical protein
LEKEMAAPSEGFQLTLYATPPLLFGESKKEFDALTAALAEEMRPGGMVERIFIGDIVGLTWEIRRLTRCKAALVNTAFRDALFEVVYKLKGEPDTGTPEADWVDAVVADFAKPAARKKILQLLAEFGLDFDAVQAEAIRSSFSELDVLDRMLSVLESRRHRALRSLEDYKGCLRAKEVREASSRIIEADVIQLGSPRRDGFDRAE